MSYFWIGLGSAIGGMARFGCSNLAARFIGIEFPWGTLMVNVIGSLLVGLLGTLALADGRLLLGVDARAFLLIGLCGGFTTFSAFSIETLQLARDGDWLQAATYVLASVVLCLLAVWLGHLGGVAIGR